MRMMVIRAIMNEAKRTGAIKETQYPFGKDKYEIQSVEAKKKALSLHQIGQIVSYRDGSETTDRYRDLWVFYVFMQWD